MDQNEKYNKAVKIETQDLFEYGMRTNIGNAFVYGDLLAVDTVTYPEIGGSYMYVEKVKERYTMHTRQVAHTRTVNGKTQTYYTTETYWTWDRVGSEDKTCNEISFWVLFLTPVRLIFPVHATLILSKNPVMFVISITALGLSSRGQSSRNYAMTLSQTEHLSMKTAPLTKL